MYMLAADSGFSDRVAAATALQLRAAPHRVEPCDPVLPVSQQVPAV